MTIVQFTPITWIEIASNGVRQRWECRLGCLGWRTVACGSGHHRGSSDEHWPHDYEQVKEFFLNVLSVSVCPTWFAPHFPVTDCSNIRTVAANVIEPQHFGQKVVRPHVTTDRGRRVLTQIKFDVMSVREPLLSTSALKRQGVTISFSHDYDRIIFRIETVNSGARDSYSYLHVTLSNESLLREVMVMTGRCGRRGARGREVSDADHRAIARSDQAGQDGISRETKTKRILRSLEPPTHAAGMLRNTTHVQFRDSSPLLLGESRERFTALTSRGEHDGCQTPKVSNRLRGFSYHGFSLVIECVAPALDVMRHPILLLEHQLWHTLPQPLLYAHFMAACQMLQVASTWICRSEQRIERFSTCSRGHCSARGGACCNCGRPLRQLGLCAIHALFASTRATDS